MASKLTPLDIFLLHQLFVEGYKNGQNEETDKYLTEAIVLLLLLLNQTGYTTLSEMPKRDFNKFVATFNAKFTALFDKFDKNITKELKQFFIADFDMNKAVFKKMGGRTYTGTPAFKLWARLQATPTAVGDEPKSLFKTFINSAKKNITVVFKRAYVDKQTIPEIIAAVRGTKALGYKDGLLNKLKNQLSATVETYIQRIANFVLHTIGSFLYETYQWVSVLDSRTTEICRSRDGNIYRYGDGPVPPAHYRCRSTIVPVIVTAIKEMPTFTEWMGAQPKAIQQEIFGKRRNGTFNQIPPLTLDGFKDKRNSLTN